MDDLSDGLKRLKLRHTRDHLDEYCQLAATRDLSFREFLKLIMTEELTARDETQRVKRLRAARITPTQNVSGFRLGFSAQFAETRNPRVTHAPLCGSA